MNEQFSTTARYTNQNWEWGYIINRKAHELSQYILGKRKTLDFSDPRANPEGYDTVDLRKKIMAISIYEWNRAGFSKGTLSYLKKRIGEGKPLNLNRHVRERVEGWGVMG